MDIRPLVALALVCSVAEAAEPVTEQDRALYSIGYMAAREVGRFKLNPQESAAVLRGVWDGARGVSVTPVDPKRQMEITRVLRRIRLRANKPFLDRAAKEPGAQRLPSGLVFKEVTAGTGASPTPADSVTVQFRGYLASDGTEYESTYRRGKPATFPMQTIIPCWSEAFQKMKVGGTARLACPAELAYGDDGYMPSIPKGEALSYEVTLVEVLPNTGPPKPQSFFPLPWVAPTVDAGEPSRP